MDFRSVVATRSGTPVPWEGCDAGLGVSAVQARNRGVSLRYSGGLALLQAVVDRGTGKGAKLDRPCAGKTGTSDGHRDCWFAGFTPQLSCVVSPLLLLILCASTPVPVCQVPLFL